MSVTIAHERIRRLVDSGLRDLCRPIERVSRLKRRVGEMDGLKLSRLEQVFSALADRTRLRMLKLIAAEELCSCEVMAALNLTQPTTSHHLGILERAGLVASRREGKWVFYRLTDRKVETLLAKGSGLMRSDV